MQALEGCRPCSLRSCPFSITRSKPGVSQRQPIQVAAPAKSRTCQGALALAAAVVVSLRRRGRVLASVRRSGDVATQTSTGTGSLLVLCGPSGVGKSTLVKGLLSHDELGECFGLVVSHTTREPRESEVDGVHYHFVRREEMEHMIEEGKFLEYADVHGNLYGTSFAAIQDICVAGRHCVLDIDVEGVKSLKAYLAHQESRLQHSYFVEVLPEGGIATLEARLRSRGVDDEASIQRRLATARKEMKEYGSIQWDSTILSVEGDIDRGVQELRRIATRLVGMPEASLAEDDEPVESPDPVQAGPTVPAGAPTKSVFGEFSGLARMLGDSCVDLGQGFPNFDPPEFVVKALRDELDGTVPGAVRTRHQYTRTAGHVTLVEALAERYSGHLGRPLDAMKEVAVTVGATNALFLAMQAALARPGAGREIVALEPFFELYRSQARSLNADFRSVALRFDESKRCFELDVEALAEALGPQTAALIVNTPHNPTGKAFEEWELKAIAKLAQQHPNLVVISDEVYKYMIFDPPSGGLANEKDSPAGHIHFAKLPGMWEKTLTVSSAGKTFGITGWQIGWLIGPSEWMEPIQRFMPNLQFCAPTLTQRALCRVLREAAEPFHGTESYYEWLRQDYARRRDIMVAALEAGGIKTARSQGGFFLLGDISGLCGPEGPLHESWEASLRPDEARDWTCCRALAAEIGIVSLPVSPFFGAGSAESIRTRFARFCFAKTDATLEEAANRLASLRA